MATHSSIPSAFAGLARTASLGATGSYQHQISGRSRAGHARGARYVQVLVADYQPQDRPASCRAGFLIGAFTTSLLTGAGFGRRPFSHSHRLVSSPSRRPVSHPLPRGIGHNSPVRAVTGCAGAFIQYDQSGSRRPVVHSMPAKQTSQSIAYRCHLSASFRNPSSFDGSKTIGKAFDEWTKTNCRTGQK